LDAKAIPYLVKWIQYEPPYWRDKLLTMARRLPKTPIRVTQLLVENRQLLAMGSLHTFPLLNTKDKPQAAAILASLIRSHPGPKAANRMMAALGLMVQRPCPP
jgi:hypothetical protein